MERYERDGMYPPKASARSSDLRFTNLAATMAASSSFDLFHGDNGSSLSSSMTSARRFPLIEEVQDSEAAMDLLPYPIATSVGELNQAPAPAVMWICEGERGGERKGKLSASLRAIDQEYELAVPRVDQAVGSLAYDTVDFFTCLICIIVIQGPSVHS